MCGVCVCVCGVCVCVCVCGGCVRVVCVYVVCVCGECVVCVYVCAVCVYIACMRMCVWEGRYTVAHYNREKILSVQMEERETVCMNDEIVS